MSAIYLKIKELEIQQIEEDMPHFERSYSAY